MKVRLAQSSDFAAILQLQAQFHLSATPETELSGGFVTTQLDAGILEKMRQQRALWVVDAGIEVVAYGCAVEWDFYSDSRFVAAVFECFPLPLDARFVEADNSFIYGPACIAPAFRGRGVLPALTNAIKARYADSREFGVCFIDTRNLRSLAAHERKLGFARLATLPFAEVTYAMLAFETAQTL